MYLARRGAEILVGGGGGGVGILVGKEEVEEGEEEEEEEVARENIKHEYSINEYTRGGINLECS